MSRLSTIPLLVALLGAGSACSPVQAEPTAEVAASRDVDVQQLEADRASGKAKVLIDVRTPGEFAEGHVPGAKNIPLDQVLSRIDELPDGEEVYLVCRSGSRSARAAAALSAKGLKTVNVKGGTMAWVAAGKAVE